MPARGQRRRRIKLRTRTGMHKPQAHRAVAPAPALFYIDEDIGDRPAEPISNLFPKRPMLMKPSRSLYRRPLRPFAFVAALISVLALTSGCALLDLKKEDPKPKPKPPDDIKPLAMGQTVTFEFPSDGRWHYSPYIAYNGHKISVRAVGKSLALPTATIQYRIGPQMMVISGMEGALVTRPGPIAFRLNPIRALGINGMVRVEISRNP